MYNINIVMICLDTSGKIIYNLGQAYTVAYLRNKGYSADIYINDGLKSLDEIVEEILSLNPSCIDFYIHDDIFYLVQEMTKRIKLKSEKKIYIIANGPTATFSSEKVLKYDSNIDLCIRNDGEETTAYFIKGLKNNDDFKRLNGITYRCESGEIISNKEAFSPKSLDVFPSPYLSGVIDVFDCQRLNNMIMLSTSRGCIHQCSYCKFSAIGGHFVRTHSIDRVIEEIKYLIKVRDERGINFDIKFMDDFFNIDRKRTLEFCRRVVEESLYFEFSIHARADYMDEELIDALFQAGCRRVSYGLESGVPRILNAMRKVNSNLSTYEKEKEYIANMRKVVALTKSKGIVTAVNVILGWDMETKEEGLKTLEIVKEIDTSRYEHNILTYYNGTEIFYKTKDKLKEKITSIEKSGMPVFNFQYTMFPELYKYNPYEIPHLPNDYFHHVQMHQKSIIQAIMGIGFSQKDYLQTLVSFSRDLTPSWLIDNAVFGVKVVFARNNSNTNKRVWYFPQNAYAYECYNYNSGLKFENSLIRKQVEMVEGKHISEQKSEIPLVFGLYDKDDVRRFLEINETFSKAKLVQKYSSKNENHFVEDLCKWCGVTQCSARGLKRLIIGEDNQIYTCFYGKPIGVYPEINDLEVLKFRVKKQFQDVYLQRGCDSCEVRNSCPKCININDIGNELYCLFQKEKKKYKNLRRIYTIKKLEYLYVL